MKTGFLFFSGIVMLFSFILSGAIIYHIWQYSPDRKSALSILFIYAGGSAFFLILGLIALLSLLMT